MDTLEDRRGRYAEWMLAKSLEDLQARMASDDDYHRLQIAAILRRTLIDGDPLINGARRRLRVPSATFGYTPYTRSGWMSANVMPLHFDVGTFSAPSTTGTLDNFLAAPVGTYGESPISVKEILRHFAHIEGGVHLGRPRDALSRYLGELFTVHSSARRTTLGLIADIAGPAARSMKETVQYISESSRSCSIRFGLESGVRAESRAPEFA